MRSRLSRRAGSHQLGVSLIEVLITVVVTVIGLLGVIALQTRAYATESESYQRAQAAILLEDMASRIRTNKLGADEYVVASLGSGAVETCAAGGSIAERDLCEWANLLRGAAETHGGSNVGAMMFGHSCIDKPNAAEPLYVVTVTWQGTVASAAPGSACGAGMYGEEQLGLRRALSTVIQIPKLED